MTQNRLEQVAAKLCNYQHLTGSKSKGFGGEPNWDFFSETFLKEDLTYHNFGVGIFSLVYLKLKSLS